MSYLNTKRWAVLITLLLAVAGVQAKLPKGVLRDVLFYDGINRVFVNKL